MERPEDSAWEFEGASVEFFKKITKKRETFLEIPISQSGTFSEEVTGKGTLSPGLPPNQAPQVFQLPPSPPKAQSIHTPPLPPNQESVLPVTQGAPSVLLSTSPPFPSGHPPLPPGNPPLPSRNPPLPSGKQPVSAANPPLLPSGNPPLPVGNPPLPPGKPPGLSLPPLPSGQPPLHHSPDSKLAPSRKAAPLPKTIDPANTIPKSVSAFKNSPQTIPSTKLQSHNTLNVSFSLGSSNNQVSESQRDRRYHRRPRGMSLSGSTVRRTLDSYEKLNQVGGGTYGDVFKARDRESGEIVALKKVRLEDEKEGFPVTALREIKFLSQVDHANIVKLKEVVSSKASDATRNKGSVYMVFEYAESDLVGLMKTAKLTEPHAMCILKQLLEALHFSHKNNVLHRDIKPANVLVNSQGIVKLADWGLCRRCVEGGKYTNRVVTRWYRAPELLLGETQYTAAVDMWAVGCLMAELLGGRALLPGKDEINQLKLILELCGTPSESEWPSGWNSLPLAGTLKNTEPLQSQFNLRFSYMRPAARDLISRLLTLDPSKRISASEALDHDYFWGKDVTPCLPEHLPRPRGDGVHEFQLREEERRAHNAKMQQQHNHHDLRKSPTKH